MSSGRKRIGETLVDMGAVDATRVQTALARQARQGGKLGQLLVESGEINEDILLQALARQLGVQAVRLNAVQPQPGITTLVPRDLAVRFNMVPLGLTREGGNEVVVVATTDPTSAQMHTLVGQRTGRTVKALLAGELDVARTLNELYPEARPAPAPPPPQVAPAQVRAVQSATRSGTLGGAPMVGMPGVGLSQDELPTLAMSTATDERPTVAMDTMEAHGQPDLSEDVEHDVELGMEDTQVADVSAAVDQAAGVSVDLDDDDMDDVDLADTDDDELEENDGIAVDLDAGPAAPGGFNGAAPPSGVPKDVRLQVMALIKQRLVEDELVYVFIEKGLVTHDEVTRLRGAPLPPRA